jgi:hypothetical protein
VVQVTWSLSTFENQKKGEISSGMGMMPHFGARRVYPADLRITAFQGFLDIHSFLCRRGDEYIFAVPRPDDPVRDKWIKDAIPPS